MASGRKSVLISTAGNFAAPAVGLATAPMLAAALGPEGRGEVAAAMATLMLCVNIGTLGLPDALVYYTARKGPRHGWLVARIISVLGLTGFICSMALATFSGFLSNGDRGLSQLIIVAGLAISPSLMLAGIRGVASGLEAWTLVTFEKLLNSTLRLIGLSVAFLTGTLDVRMATTIMVVTTFLGFVAYIPLRSIARGYQPQNPQSADSKSILTFGTKVWIGSLTGVLLSRLDQALMVPLAGTHELGLYAVAVSISEIALIFNSAVAAVMYSRESKLRDLGLLALATRISSMVTYCGCVCISISAIWLVPTLFGNEFSDVVPVLWILLLGVALGNSGSVAGAGLIGRGRPEMRSISLAIALCVNIVSLLILAPVIGALGAAIATTLGNIVAGGLNLVWMKLLFGCNIRHFLGFRASDAKYLVGSVGSSRL